MRVTFVSSAGPWLEAILDTPFGRLAVMDELSISEADAPKPGQELEVELVAEIGKFTWEEAFSGNPAKRKGLESSGGWSYRAFGEIVSIDPVVVDCAVLEASDVIFTHDPKVIGEFISFPIDRLNAYPVEG